MKGGPVLAAVALGAAVIGAWQWTAGDPPDASPEAAHAAAAAAASAQASSPWLSPSAGEAPAEAASAAPVTLAAAVQLPPIPALRALQQCYAADSCGGSAQDTLSTHFAVSEQISKRLATLQPDSAGTAELAALAREFLKFPDGHVQAAALALAAKLPADAQTAAAAIAALGDSYDQLLFRKALPVLQQWQGQGLASGLDDMLFNTVSTGGIHAAQVVAEGLTPFLNDANFARYEALAAQMQPGMRQSALQRSLRDYRLMKTGA